MKTIVKGIATEYRDEGAGPTLLMLHGWGDSLHSFDALVSGLEGYRKVRLDLPGFGETELPRGVWDVAEYARFVHEFCTKVGVSPEFALGHSFGGRILVKAVGSNILNAKKLVLIGSAGVADRPTMHNYFFTAIAKIGKVILTPIPTDWYLRLRKELYRVTGGDYVSAGALKETFLKVIQEDLSGSAKNISIPTLLIWGEDDIVTPLGEAKKFNQLIQDSDLKVLRGAGHFVHQQKAGEVADLIREFLA